MDKQPVSRYDCTAKVQTVGREEASRDSRLRRRRDGTLYLIDIGDTYYHHGDSAPASGDWVELYQIPYGRGQHLLGYFEASEFDIVGPVEEDSR